MFSRALIVVTSTLAYEVHWLRFQDLSLIGPAILKRGTIQESHKHKHLILFKKLKVFRTAITLQDTAFGSVCQVHPPILRSLPHRLLIVVTNTLAYTLHCLRFQDLPLIGPAKRHNRQRKS